ncbi:MAG TPA: ABC transporter permease subunit [Smithellaceae bacterium]|jgi:phosphate transport system permease protein|nr:ABC transporter permease subunit [Smithellaceae bacterium]HPL49017.1 ABC transporter permease subunit [Smithella sp.]
MIKRFGFWMEKGFLAAALWSMFLTILIFAFMLVLGLPLFKEGRLLSLLTSPWAPGEGQFGIYPMIISTTAISFLSLCLGAPLALGVSIFICLIQPGRLGRWLKKVVVLMTAVPTVVYAFVGVFLLVPLVQSVFSAGSGMNILTACFVLALLIAPTMILIFSNSFNNVPLAHQYAADALGASSAQKLFYVILPASWRGIVAGLILGAGRAMGDTLVALMLAGNAVAVPGSIFDSARTLTAHIALVTAADFDSVEFRTIFACGILLYLMTLIMVLAVRFLSSLKKEADL